MSKPMKRMLIILAIIFGLIFIYHFIQGLMIKNYMAKYAENAVTVSTIKTTYNPWQSHLSATGSIRAIRGVNVTTELAGMVENIYFTPGSMVTKGALLVQLNADAEIGQLHSLQANLELAKITYRRDLAQYAAQAISKQTLDTDYQNVKSLEGQVAQQAATVAKKTIRAPFSGRIGINNVNPGQYLNVGDAVATLQTLNPIYIDFYLPQQKISQLRYGQKVTVISDVYPGRSYQGKITTINPAVDVSTRNIEVEATISNPNYQLMPGMFATVNVITGAPKKLLTLPQAAVSFNPYGDLVYIVHENNEDKKKPFLFVKQSFVTTGETRGDQIAILKGLKEGDVVVTSGQLKLKNNSRIVINNSIQPSNSPNPTIDTHEE